jgi:hypothetical protein
MVSLGSSLPQLSLSSMPSPYTRPEIPASREARSRLKSQNSPSAQNVLDQIYSSGVVPIDAARSASPTVFTQHGVIESVPIVPSFIANGTVKTQNITQNISGAPAPRELSVYEGLSTPRSPRSSSPNVLPVLPDYVPLGLDIQRPRTPPKVTPPASPSRSPPPRSSTPNSNDPMHRQMLDTTLMRGVTPRVSSYNPLPVLPDLSRSKMGSYNVLPVHDESPRSSKHASYNQHKFSERMDASRQGSYNGVPSPRELQIPDHKEPHMKEGIDSNLILNHMLLDDTSHPKPVSQYIKEDTISKPTKSMQPIHDYIETVSETSIESQLSKYKYTIIDRVVLKRDDGFRVGYNVEYVKCYDPNGLTVFVMLDVKGSLGVQMPDLTTVHVAKGSSIPLSDKLAANDCAGTGVCGVALECQDELCTILRQNDGSSKEASFVMTEEYATKTMARDGSAVASVIIRMSEIMQDYKGTLDRTQTASQRIKDNAFQASHDGLVRTMKKAQTLTEGIAKFDSNRKLAYQSLKQGINQLQTYSDKYYSMYTDKTITSQNNNQYNLTIGNLYARNKVFGDIITTTTAFNDLEKEIEAIASKVIALNNSLCAKHEKVTGELTMEQIRAVINM